IQVLDDSTDETCSVAELAMRRLASQGVDIKCLHRTNRVGFKAGALEVGLKTARGEFVAIFDADFIPTPDFLVKLLPHFVDPQVGMVQARWGHINQDYSLLTKIQSILLRSLRARAWRPKSGRPVLQFQRHGRYVAPRSDRRCRRVAARYAHRGPRSQLSRAASRVA